MSKRAYDTLIESLRQSMSKCIETFCYTDAIFFADKVLALSMDKSEYAIAVYDLAYCYFLNKEYLRCVSHISKHELTYESEKFRILVA